MALRKQTNGKQFEPPHGAPARLPYMPVFVDDWLSSLAIGSFTLEQEGAYWRLLTWAWKDPTCSLPRDENTLATYSRLGVRWRKLGRPIITRCFVVEDERLVNRKLRRIWEQVHERSLKAKASAELRWAKERQRPLIDDG
jgi:uncharacterized protein YdaU (DUF1376 family)